MAGRSAHLIDQVFPDAPVRQWVLSLPHRARCLLNAHLHALVLDGVFATDGARVRFHSVRRLTRAPVPQPLMRSRRCHSARVLDVASPGFHLNFTSSSLSRPPAGAIVSHTFLPSKEAHMWLLRKIMTRPAVGFGLTLASAGLLGIACSDTRTPVEPSSASIPDTEAATHVRPEGSHGHHRGPSGVLASTGLQDELGQVRQLTARYHRGKRRWKLVTSLVT